MKLSIIIVNYNVEHFLEQCLISVQKASKEINSEIYVVDNNSIDGSVAMVKEKFPEVIIVANKENLGFSKANNQAIKLSKGEMVLLLNPDTIVEEDTFTKCLKFMDEHEDAGGLGVKMIDGKGKFLPESKRGLPTPSVAFYKIFGFSYLFPRSKKMGQYHLGYLSKDQNHEVQILSGAYMLIRKTVLNKIGLLDENFFMYGEDIDLSYRIIQGGYKNYYFSKTNIIHYKGESTKKSSVNYVFVFYNAMIIFAKKHFSTKNAKLFSFFINIAIYLRAGIAILNRVIKKYSLPFIDFLLSGSSIYLISYYYQQLTGITFPENIIFLAIPVYTLIWILSGIVLGAYDKPYRLFQLLKSTILGTIIILSCYALLPKEYQFSRSIIIYSSLSIFFTSFFNRIIFHLTGIGKLKLPNRNKKRFAIVGSKSEGERIKNLLEQIAQIENIYFVNPDPHKNNESYDAQINQLNDLVNIRKIDEVVFCAKDISAQLTIEIMSAFSNNQKVDFKISQPNTYFLIGSNSIHSSGDLYMIDMNNINRNNNKRSKRLIDFSCSLLLFISYPLLIWMYKHPLLAFKNIIKVLFGIKTWVGYSKLSDRQKLPEIKQGVLSVSDGIVPITDDISLKLNIIYAKDYSPLADIKVLIRNLKKIGTNR